MDIFESLENLNVSEECFEDIVSIVELYLDMGHRALRMQPENKELQAKAYKFDKKMNEINREKLKKGGKEAEEVDRKTDSVLDRYPEFGVGDKIRYAEKRDPDYKYHKKLAKTALKTKAPGTKRNTRIIRNAKQGSYRALSELGNRIRLRNKNGKGTVSYDSYNKTPKGDLMDVIARKSPGVSFTSDEWHNNH